MESLRDFAARCKGLDEPAFTTLYSHPFLVVEKYQEMVEVGAAASTVSDFDDEGGSGLAWEVGGATGARVFFVTSQSAATPAVAIGRSPECPLQIRHDKVSRRHGVLQAGAIGQSNRRASSAHSDMPALMYFRGRQGDDCQLD